MPFVACSGVYTEFLLKNLDLSIDFQVRAQHRWVSALQTELRTGSFCDGQLLPVELRA